MKLESFESRAWKLTNQIDYLAGRGTAGEVLDGLAAELQTAIDMRILDPVRSGIVVAALRHLADGGDPSTRVSRILGDLLLAAQPQPEVPA